MDGYRDGWMDRHMDAQTDRWTGRWTNWWMDRQAALHPHSTGDHAATLPPCCTPRSMLCPLRQRRHQCPDWAEGWDMLGGTMGTGGHCRGGSRQSHELAVGHHRCVWVQR